MLAEVMVLEFECVPWSLLLYSLEPLERAVPTTPFIYVQTGIGLAWGGFVLRASNTVIHLPDTQDTELKSDTKEVQHSQATPSFCNLKWRPPLPKKTFNFGPCGTETQSRQPKALNVSIYPALVCISNQISNSTRKVCNDVNQNQCFHKLCTS